MCSSEKSTGFSISCFSHSLCSSKLRSLLMVTFLLEYGEERFSVPKSHPELALLAPIVEPRLDLPRMVKYRSISDKMVES